MSLHHCQGCEAKQVFTAAQELGEPGSTARAAAVQGYRNRGKSTPPAPAEPAVGTCKDKRLGDEVERPELKRGEPNNRGTAANTSQKSTVRP